MTLDDTATNSDNTFGIGPVLAEMWQSWRQYEFENPEEAQLYTSSVARLIVGVPVELRDSWQYVNFQTPEAVLESFPLRQLLGERAFTPERIRDEEMIKFGSPNELLEFIETYRNR